LPERYWFTLYLVDYRAEPQASLEWVFPAITGIFPGNSVTNSYKQVQDTSNIFVTGAALFLQNLRASPTDTFTLAVLAYRTGDAICNKYFRNEGDDQWITLGISFTFFC
jgi:gluconate 2-dehydrogenase alpha chain